MNLPLCDKNAGTTLKLDRETREFEMVNIGRYRCCCALLVNVARAAIAGSLCYFGIQFVG